MLAIPVLACQSPSQRNRDAQALALDAGLSAAARLVSVENQRIFDGITDDDLGSRDPAIRRRAARALARIGNPGAVNSLFKALSDEDGDVVAWGAYGLGYACRSEGVNAAEIVRGLVTRAPTLPPPVVAELDPTFALARALGHCASDEAEKTLEAWLSGPRPRASFAALGIGDIASKRKTLAEPTQLALLAAAAGSLTSAPLPSALYAFGRLEHPLESALDRLREVASARLADAGPDRIFAIRALSRAGGKAAGELGRILTAAEGFTPAERAEAARGLGRLGDAGQRRLAEALSSLVPARDPLALTTLGTSAFGPLLVALETLQRSDRAPAKRLLYELAGLAAPKDAPAVLARRVTRLRCRAAALLVNGAAEEPLLVRCDPDENGEIGQRAQLEILGRRPIQGRRLALFRKLLGSPHVRVREAAVELLGAHPEIEDVSTIIGAALAASEAGLVATAAEVATRHPERLAGTQHASRRTADAGALAPAAIAPEVSNGLKRALEREWPGDAIETVGALLEASGALRFEAATAKLESYCRHPNPTLREHAARALALMKNAKSSCETAALPAEAAPELTHLVPTPVKLDIVTDAGPLGLMLDPTVAPVTLTRIAYLAREGFYNGIVVHRVVHGFVVQFGDPAGDGFGGPGRQPLRCETTPAPFEPFDVGIALAGRDTGSSQLFITLARYPHLDQEYARIGKATGDWQALAEGDFIRTVTVAR